MMVTALLTSIMMLTCGAPRAENPDLIRVIRG